jgi:heat shock protein HslJ
MKRLASLALLALSVAACLGSDFADSLEGSWVLDSGASDGRPITILDSHPITMRLDGSRIVGTAACNTYSGNYRVASNGNFQLVDGLAVTEMACSPEEGMESEAQFLAALTSVDKIAFESGTLTLTGGGHELVFSRDEDAPPLGAGTTTDEPDTPVSNVEWFGAETYGNWVLASGTADGVAVPMVDSHPITLTVAESGFGGKVCNEYGYALPLPEDGSFPDIVSTLMLCTPEEVMASETAYLAALQRYQSSSIVDGRLVIVGDGVELVYDPA